MLKLKSLWLIILFIGIFSYQNIGAMAQLDKRKVSLTVLHTNDVHGYFMANKKSIGSAYMSTYIEKKRQEGSVLLLDAGDAIFGNSLANFSQGKAAIDVMNLMKYDMLAIGNHEFDYGSDNLINLIKQAQFPLISANIQVKNNNKFFTDKAYIIKKIDGIKIGILGLTTPDTNFLTNPVNVSNLDFKNDISSAQKIVNILKKKEKVDFIIAVGHIGINNDKKNGPVVNIMKNNKDINLFIDGHSHTALEEGVTLSNTQLIAQTGYYGRNLGQVDISFMASGNNIDFSSLTMKSQLISKDMFQKMDLEANKEIETLLEKTEKEFESYAQTVVGESKFVLTGGSQYRKEESTLGDFITDILIETTQADVSIINSGGVRVPLEDGVITQEDILNILPFNNYITVVNLSGKELKMALEQGLQSLPESSGSFPQVGGMKVFYNENNPPMQKVEKIQIWDKKDTWQDLNETTIYKVAIPDFLANGGDRYTLFTHKEPEGMYDVMADAVTQTIKNKGIAPKYARIQNRLISIKSS